MPPEPSTGSGSRGPRSPLRDHARKESRADFAARLNGRQVASELDEFFRESPDFGRTLSIRLEPFLDESAEGPLTLIGAGGEVSVFFDVAHQSVVKLSGPPARCGFGWIIRKNENGHLTLSPGSLDEMLNRLALFEALFPSGLSIDAIGEVDDFLTIR